MKYRIGAKETMEVLSILQDNLGLLTIGTVIILTIILSRKAYRAFTAWLHMKAAEIELKEFELKVNTKVTDDVEQRLDKIIEDCFQEYTLTNVIYKTDWYITEPEELQINKDINALVSERLSDIVMFQLSLYYKEDAITDIIAKRVYFKVTNFVIEHNKNTGI